MKEGQTQHEVLLYSVVKGIIESTGVLYSILYRFVPCEKTNSCEKDYEKRERFI
jgi:hypothetical protein